MYAIHAGTNQESVNWPCIDGTGERASQAEPSYISVYVSRFAITNIAV